MKRIQQESDQKNTTSRPARARPAEASAGPACGPAAEPHSHRFFRNTDCHYFPCHQGVRPEEFNCLFCFCPLYFLENCGGTPDVSRGIKDCTPCLNPHAAGGYERVLARLKAEFARMRNTGQGDGKGERRS